MLGDQSGLFGLHVLRQFLNRSLMALFKLFSHLIGLLREATFLLSDAVCHSCKLSIQTFDLLILPLLLLSQNLEVKLDVCGVIGL